MSSHPHNIVQAVTPQLMRLTKNSRPSLAHRCRARWSLQASANGGFTSTLCSAARAVTWQRGVLGAAAAVVSAREAAGEHSIVVKPLQLCKGFRTMLCLKAASLARAHCCRPALASSPAAGGHCCWRGVTLLPTGVCVCYCIWSAVHTAVSWTTVVSGYELPWVQPACGMDTNTAFPRRPTTSSPARMVEATINDQKPFDLSWLLAELPGLLYVVQHQHCKHTFGQSSACLFNPGTGLTQITRFLLYSKMLISAAGQQTWSITRDVVDRRYSGRVLLAVVAASG
jgi:hypothetical protein